MLARKYVQHGGVLWIWLVLNDRVAEKSAGGGRRVTIYVSCLSSYFFSLQYGYYCLYLHGSAMFQQVNLTGLRKSYTEYTFAILFIRRIDLLTV